MSATCLCGLTKHRCCHRLIAVPLRRSYKFYLKWHPGLLLSSGAIGVVSVSKNWSKGTDVQSINPLLPAERLAELLLQSTAYLPVIF